MNHQDITLLNGDILRIRKGAKSTAYSLLAKGGDRFHAISKEDATSYVKGVGFTLSFLASLAEVDIIDQEVQL